ncbi:MAG TPA: M20/M25/M40 family metallo-hydrolase [Pyrinomonadaceae bacterium]|nr:M20/M25/M40 family metallo-hydrolase [Pyrinomonadaceae bacterium]
MTRPRAASAMLILALLAPGLTGARAQQTTPAAPQAAPTPAPLTDPVERIKDEGLNRSQVMETIWYLTDVIGPRLTGSPALKRANAWTRDRLAGWGLQGARLEAWGPFGRGWTLRRFSAEVVAPQSFTLLAAPRAWSPGLDGPLTSEVVLVEAATEEELQKYKGRLRGRAVLTGAVRELRPKFDPVATRLTERQLLDLANAPDPALAPPRRPAPPTAEQLAQARWADRLTRFFYEEGAALLVGPSPAGDGGTLQFVHSAAVPQPFDTPPEERIGPWDARAPKLIPQIALSNDHFNRLARMIRRGERVEVAVNLRVEFDDTDPMAYNTVAEIPGTDLKEEVVMLGAHLDSWHTATGATDNAAGVGIMMEAVRILRALDLRPRRTVRIALWTGEEQGLRGSRAYVREHFGPEPATTPAEAARPRFKPEHGRLNVYFNADSGTGAIRGIYLQGNEALRPIFRRWLMPFRDFRVGGRDYSATTITVSNAVGSDFLAFQAVGLNGLDFLQDDIEYEARTWHSSQDTFDRIVPEDVKQAAIIVAAFVYNAATETERLPRKTR